MQTNKSLKSAKNEIKCNIYSAPQLYSCKHKKFLLQIFFKHKFSNKNVKGKTDLKVNCSFCPGAGEAAELLLAFHLKTSARHSNAKCHHGAQNIRSKKTFPIETHWTTRCYEMLLFFCCFSSHINICLNINRTTKDKLASISRLAFSLRENVGVKIVNVNRTCQACLS